MKSFHVYLTSKDSPLEVVETTGCNSLEAVEALLPTDVHWYGVLANSPEEAIAIAESDNLRERYRDPGEIKALNLELDALEEVLNPLQGSFSWEQKDLSELDALGGALNELRKSLSWVQSAYELPKEAGWQPPTEPF